MSKDHIAHYRRARENLVSQRRELASVLARPFDNRRTEIWRVRLFEVQNAIDAIDAALAEEKAANRGFAALRSLWAKPSPRSLESVGNFLPEDDRSSRSP